MIKTSTFHAQLSNVCVDSDRPLLIIGTRNAPPRWVGALENWCRNAPKQEQSNRVEAAKRVLQQYADPKNSTLDLSRMALTALPPGLSHLANLQELNVSQNPGLQRLPDDLGRCLTLRSIDASSCSISEWPACLSRLPSLETLLLDDNPGLRVFPDQIRRCFALENLRMEATMSRDFNHPSIRPLLSGDDARGRAIVRSAPPSPRQLHDNVQTKSASASLSKLLGFRKAHQLDKDFGSLQWPRDDPGFPSIKPWEFDAAGAPLMLDDRIFVPDEKGHFVNLAALLDLEKLKTGEKLYMWSVSKLGRLIISEEREISVNTPNGEEQKYIGHPSLVGGGRARISGELWFKADPNNPSSGKFYISNESGRFSTFTDRNESQLIRVAGLFRKAGLAVETAVYKKTGKQLLPVSGLQHPTGMTRQSFQRKTTAQKGLRPHRPR